jgi:hypothetical protein
MTTAQSSLGWRKPTHRFIVEIQRVDPRFIVVKKKRNSLTSNSKSSLLPLLIPIFVILCAVE